jgi:hypothetical protein
VKQWLVSESKPAELQSKEDVNRSFVTTETATSAAAFKGTDDNFVYREVWRLCSLSSKVRLYSVQKIQKILPGRYQDSHMKHCAELRPCQARSGESRSVIHGTRLQG